MPTSLVNLDVNQYVKVTPDTLVMSSLLLQSHRDTVRITSSINQPVKSNTVFHELSGKHSILNVKLTETPLWALAMTDRSKLTITEQREPIEISDRGDIGNAVYIQDQTSPIKLSISIVSTTTSKTNACIKPLIFFMLITSFALIP